MKKPLITPYPFVVAASSNFSGSTIFTSSTVTFNNTANTEVNSSSGMVTSSQSGSINDDIIQNNTTITSANLFAYFFSQPASTIQSGANQSYNSSNINGATGATIWTSGLSLTSGTTVGSATSPVILIVDGNLTIASGVTIYGFVYVFQSLTMNGGTINGAVAAIQAVNLNDASTIVYNPTILAAAQKLNSDTNLNYLSPLVGYQELFS